MKELSKDVTPQVRLHLDNAAHIPTLHAFIAWHISCTNLRYKVTTALAGLPPHCLDMRALGRKKFWMAGLDMG